MMRIAIMGAGALGSYVGGRLAAAGSNVSFVARGAQLAALRQHGLRIESPIGKLQLDKIVATSDPREVGAVDVVVFLVKLYDTETAARAVAPLLGRQTTIVSFQNGIDGWERVAAIAGKDRVLGGVALLPVVLESPGVVRHKTRSAKLTLGEFDGRITARTEAIEQALNVAGLEARAIADIEAQIWEKFIMLSTMSGVTALTRLPIGSVLADELCADLYRRARDEAARVGHKRCAGLAKDVADRQMALSRAAPPNIKPSMLDDLERGRRLELNDLSGAVVRLGRELEVETPVHAIIHAALQPFVMGAHPASSAETAAEEPASP